MGRRKRKKHAASGSVNSKAAEHISKWSGSKAGSTSWHWRGKSGNKNEGKIKRKLQEFSGTSLKTKKVETPETKWLTNCPFCNSPISRGSLSQHLSKNPDCLKAI